MVTEEAKRLRLVLWRAEAPNDGRCWGFVFDRLAEPSAMRGVPEHVCSNKESEVIAQGCWLKLVGVGTLDI